MPHAPSHHLPRPWEMGHPLRQWRSKEEQETAMAAQMAGVIPVISKLIINEDRRVE